MSIETFWDAFEKEQMKEMLYVITNFLKVNNIDYILMCGTLLGCIRENDLITGDHDLDLAVPDFKWKDIDWDELFEVLRTEFPESRIMIYRNSCQPFIRCYTISVSGVKCDISELIPYKDFYKWYFPPDMRIQKIITNFIKINRPTLYYDSMNNLTKNYDILKSIFWMFSMPKYKLFPRRIFVGYNLKGIPVSVPINYDDYLFLLYGENWMFKNSNYADSEDRKKNRKRKKL